MHTLSALEVKRRGVAALEEALKQGPVHIIKNNQPRCVVLSEEDYSALLKHQKMAETSLWDLLDARPWKGRQTKKALDKRIKQERGSWD